LSRRRQFGLNRAAAAVLGDQHIDPVIPEQR
jgi:hypothetical protein